MRTGPIFLHRTQALTTALAAALVLAGCGEGDPSGDPGDGGRGDADATPDVPDGSPGVPDGSPDAADGPRIVSSAIGTLDAVGSAVRDVPYGTLASALAEGLVVSDGAEIAIVDAESTAVPGSTPLEPGLSIRLVEGDETKSYEVALETLTNTTVVIVDGTPIRFGTRYFSQTGELIVIETGDGRFSHYCFADDITTGTYGPTSGGDVGGCIELDDPAGVEISAGEDTRFGPLTMTLTVSASAIGGRYEGTLSSHGGGEDLEVIGWFHSDRVESGGW